VLEDPVELRAQAAVRNVVDDHRQEREVELAVGAGIESAAPSR
jgi:hypothetical protein